MATVTGLSATKYYIDNPIWVDVDTTGDAVTDVVNLVITQNATIVFSAKYYTFNNLVSFELSEIIKGLIAEPMHPVNIISGAFIPNNKVTLSISLPSFTQTKTFYRGGLLSDATNIQVPNNSVLSESEKIPVWTGYPSAKYYLNNAGDIVYTQVIPSAESESRMVVNCNSVFLRFLNSRGGYSFWLFEQWDIKDKYKKGTRIKRRVQDLDLGNKPEFSLSVSSRAEERYLATMRALLQSTEIYVYRIDRIITESNPVYPTAKTWTPVYNGGGDIEWNAFDSVYEVDFNLDIDLKNNPSLT